MLFDPIRKAHIPLRIFRNNYHSRPAINVIMMITYARVINILSTAHLLPSEATKEGK